MAFFVFGVVGFPEIYGLIADLRSSIADGFFYLGGRGLIVHLKSSNADGFMCYSEFFLSNPRQLNWIRLP